MLIDKVKDYLRLHTIEGALHKDWLEISAKEICQLFPKCDMDCGNECKPKSSKICSFCHGLGWINDEDDTSTECPVCHNETKPDELLTEEEMVKASGMDTKYWNDTFTFKRCLEGMTLVAKAQLIKCQQHEQARVERIKKWGEEHCPHSPRHFSSDKRVCIQCWDEFWKKEGL